MNGSGFIFSFFLALILSIQSHGQSTGNTRHDSYIPYHPEYLSDIKNVEDICQDKSGFIWLTTNYGLIRLDGRSGKRITKFSFAGLKSNNFYRNLEVRDYGVTFFRDEPGNLYLPDGYGGILDVESSEKQFHELIPSRAIRDSVGKKSMAVILNAGDAYVFSYPGNLERYSAETGFQKTNVTASYGIASGFFASYGAHVWINRNGRVDRVTGDHVEQMIPKGWNGKAGASMWLFSSGTDGLFLVSGGELFRCKADANGEITAEVIQGIQLKNIVTSVFEEPATGFIYVGSSAGGLEIFQPRRFRHITAGSAVADEKAFFYSPLVLDSKYGIACVDRSVFLFSPQNNKRIFRGSADFNYAALYRAGDGRIWFENKGGAIESIDPFGINPQPQEVFDFNEEVRHILNNAGVTYVLTARSLYAMKTMSAGKYSIERVWKIFEQHRGEKLNRANTIHFENEHKVLIGHVSGLLSLDLKTGKQKIIKGTQEANVRTLSVVEGLGLMAGTYGDGYFLIRDSAAVQMPVDSKGVLNTVHAFIGDSRGYLWMPTNEGLVRARIQELRAASEKTGGIQPRFDRYTELDGLISNEFNGGTNPSYAMKGDTVILASSKGLTFFRPDDFPPPADYPMVVYQFKDQSLIHIKGRVEGKSNEVLQLLIDRVKSPATDYESVWYRLVPGGLWTEGVVNENIYIGMLWGGAYRLEFLSRDPRIEADAKPDKADLEVKAVWYQTGFFFIAVMLAAAGFIWLLIWIRTYFIAQQRLALQKEVAVKTGELNRINAELNLRNEELSLSVAETKKQIVFREKVLLVLLHDLKSPMRFVTSSLRRLYSELGVGTKPRAISGELVTSVSGIYKFMEDFHNWVIQNNTEQKKADFVSLPLLLEEIREFYEQVAVVYGNTLEVESEEIVLKTYIFTLKTIIGNLVDNAIKNTGGGTVRIAAYDSLSYVNIEVRDSGRGMPAEYLLQVQQRAENAERVKVPSIGSGVGYSIISEFLTSVYGLICIDSAEGTGTTITISIPKNQL